MSFTTIRYDTKGGVATITLDRPESRNALNRAMCEDLVAAAAAATADADARLVLVRAAGPVFCAGADLKERKEMSVDDVRNRRLRGYAAYHALETLPMPVVAVVHGAAIGSGAEIAASCDFIVATPEATFATPEAMWGTVGATQRLPRVLGKRLAKDLMFTGRKLRRPEAPGW
jgi:enoyl-CoA hydratase